jgi:putative PEP-CTERM system histidine kinase
MSVWFGAASHGVAAIVYAAIAAILLASHPGGRRAASLHVAVAMSVVWALGTTALLLFGRLGLVSVIVLDALHMLAWTAYTLSWLAPPAIGPKRFVLDRRWLFALSALAGVWAIIAAIVAPFELVAIGAAPGLLTMAFVGLLAVEQVFRNSREEQRRSLWLLCLFLGGIFIIHLFIYSQAALLRGFVGLFWESRGLATAALAPLLVFAIKRQSEWERELFVSRQVAFYTASLLAVGAYFVGMGVVAYVIRALGGQWGLLLEFAFLIVAAGLLVIVLRSSLLQARLKVFLVKHFYRNKYDYRVEWLRLTDALGRAGGPRELAKSALGGLTSIVGAGRGDMWLMRDRDRYDWMVSLETNSVAKPSYSATDPLVRFLGTKGWVIDSQEYAMEPDLYGSAFGHPGNGVLPQGALVIPLDCQGKLLGFVILSRPEELGALNFEDHDILKTAGRQVAMVLAQALAQEQLLETRQFEAINKLSTFLMHDLKNVVAQQELVVANAQRFRDRPEFIDDMITTIRSGAERMRRVLDRLRGAVPEATSRHRTDVSKVIREVRSHCADRQPVPTMQLVDTPMYVDIERDKLNSVITHLIRNAQDATRAEGSIDLSLRFDGTDILITVADTGCGMDQMFIRDRLFRPFDSTKGAKGMGIGAYQVREIVRSAGGDIDVRSEVGVGTEFSVKLPAVVPRGATSAQTVAEEK